MTEGVRPRRTWQVTLLQIMAIVAVIAITVFIFSIQDRADELQAYGYPGIFLLSVLSNATVILPAPGIAIIFAAGAVFNPLGIGLAAGAGAAIGEMTGYLAGYGGRAVVERSKVYQTLEKWTERYGGWTILFLAALPNPFFDIAGAAAGVLRMPVATFLFWAWIGKTIKMLAVAYGGALSVDWVLRILGWGVVN